MEIHYDELIWVAVKVKRGFIVEVHGYKNKLTAEKQKKEWINNMNRDYDEAEVLPLIMHNF